MIAGASSAASWAQNICSAHGKCQNIAIYLGQHGCGPLAFLLRGVVQLVWLKRVEFSQFIHGEVTLNLLLVHYSE